MSIETFIARVKEKLDVKNYSSSVVPTLKIIAAIPATEKTKLI